MAHNDQFQFIESVSRFAPQRFRGRTVLEVGSLDINGSVRRCFEQCDYLGIDIAAGPGVDLVCEGQSYAGKDEAFDVVISCECMEHNPYWKETFRNMVRVCRADGLVLMTCATTGREEHGTANSDPGASPLTVGKGWNYYRNISRRDWMTSFPLDQWFSDYSLWVNWSSCDLYFAGLKQGAKGAASQHEQWQRVDSEVSKLIEAKNAPFMSRATWLLASAFGDSGVGTAKKLWRWSREVFHRGPN